MVKPIHICPRFRAVAGFASEWRSIWPPPLHPVVELSMMRVSVASSARAIFEVKRKYFVRSVRRANRMAVRAGDRHVRTSQRKLALPVLRNRKQGSVKIHHRVAILTAIAIRLCGELSVVRILVTIHAIRKFHFVQRVFSGGDMALGALHFRVLPFQRIL